LKTLVIPDVHVPFHCRDAEVKIHSIIKKFKPDKIIFLGDVADLHALTVHRQSPRWQDRLEVELEETHNYLARVRKRAGARCKIIYIKGNHEDRWDRMVQGRLPAMRLIGWSLPRQLELKELGIEWIYDAGQKPVRISAGDGSKVRLMHGHEIKGGSPFPGRHALKMATLLGENLIIGHTHRFGLMAFTLPKGAQDYYACELGFVADKSRAGMRYAYPNTNWVKYVALFDSKNDYCSLPTFVKV
jgi:predicted phosphodiesterase